jgi:hypothetical protein
MVQNEEDHVEASQWNRTRKMTATKNVKYDVENLYNIYIYHTHTHTHTQRYRFRLT